MTVFTDTSAFYALLDADDANHARAVSAWKTFLSDERLLVTTNYVVVESSALLQARLGAPAVRFFFEDVLPLSEVKWIDENVHASAVSALLALNRRNISLVDLSSFETMRRSAIRDAFAFDRHFRQYGYVCLPGT